MVNPASAYLRIALVMLLGCFISGCSLSGDDSSLLSADGGGGERIALGEEYPEYARSTPGGSGESSESVFSSILYYLPNRLLDFVDIFRADVGVGPTSGGVIRLSKYFQVGGRFVTPFSLRLGMQGRRAPVFLETSNEFGIGAGYVESRDRVVESGEIGAGVDIILVGAYLGVNFTEVPDFLAGFLFFDPSEDDL